MAESWKEEIARLKRDYFAAPSRRLRFAAGEEVMPLGGPNDRLYFVLSGRFAGTVPMEDDLGEKRWLELFHVIPGDFLGVNSFFSWKGLSSTRVVATEDGELAWIDRSTPPVEAEKYGDLMAQMVPVVVAESSRRLFRLMDMVRERERTLHRLYRMEQYSTLGQLAAGLAHELNNAVGVMERTTDRLADSYERLIERTEPNLGIWFARGLEHGQTISSSQVRERAAEIQKEFSVDYPLAKDLARLAGGEPLAALPEPLEECLILWRAGCDFRSLRLAAQHAAAIVRSVRQLGGGERTRGEGVNINDTLREALDLLESQLRPVSVVYEPGGDVPLIWGNASELVQVWINIIKNGCEAMRDAHTVNPRVTVASARHGRGVGVILANNGPPIPENLRQNLFRPNITSKRGQGEHMGLGLGMYISKSLVDSYNGELLVESGERETRFIVRLPAGRENAGEAVVPGG